MNSQPETNNTPMRVRIAQGGTFSKAYCRCKTCKKKCPFIHWRTSEWSYCSVECLKAHAAKLPKRVVFVSASGPIENGERELQCGVAA